MTKFIERVLETASNFDAAETAVVFPSLRAISYLREEYKKTKKTQLLPKMLTMDMFVSEVSSLKEEDELLIAAEAYKAFKQKNKSRDFISFLNVFPAIMNDFNDIDMYLKDVKLLKNLKEIAKLESSKEGSGAEKYYKLMVSMEDIYFNLNKYLDERKRGYRGKIYRKAVESSKEFDAYDNVIFAGFNILTKSEEDIIENLKDRVNVKLLFNIPKILYDSNHESAEFIRKYHERWRKISEVCDCTENERISVYSYSLSTEQPGVISKELENGRGAVVLCDESMMIPAVCGVPKNVSGINITMGYPISMIPLFFFFKNLMSLHKNRTEYGFRKNDLLNLIGSPYLRRMNPEYFEKTEKEIEKMKVTFIRYESAFSKNREKILEDTFEWYDNTGNILSVQEILGKLSTLFEAAGRENSESPYIESSAVLMRNTIKRISTLLEENEEIFIENSPSRIESIISTIFLKERIPFSGDPLTEFQMMGMLETRCLQFDKTIIMSVNEGTIPKSKRTNSFLPYDIRKELNLPTYEQNDKLFSYYFYTLLLNSRESIVTYSRSNSDSTEERSRLIEQILWENRIGGIFEDKNIQMHSPESDVSSVVCLREVEKSQTVNNMMEDISLSPSTINTFMNCPIDFYFKNVLKVNEGGNDDELGMDIVGTVAHYALQKIYENQVGREFCIENLNYSDDIIKRCIAESFTSSGITSMMSGKPLLMEKVILKMLKSFIEADTERNKGKIVLAGLEKNMNCEISHGGRKIILRGTFDRIEFADNGNIVRIMDYKSGKVDPADLSIGNPDLLIDVDNWLESDSDHWSKKLQLLCYGYIAKTTKEFEGKRIQVGIYSLRSPGKRFMLKYGAKCTEKNMRGTDFEYTDEADNKFKKIIERIAGEIFDTTKPFKKKNSEKLYCKW